MIHGAKVIQIKGNFDEALKMVLEIGKNYPIEIVNSVNPHRLQGQKTAAFEVCEALGDAPTHHFLPVGNAGNISAYWMGYQEWFCAKKSSRKPKMMGFQAAKAAPLVLGKPVPNPQTIATAIRIGNPASWNTAILSRDQSGGMIDKITDAEIVRTYKLIAATEGYFCEPASAISVAGVIKTNKAKPFIRDDLIVCTLTGHGLKDPDTAIKNSIKPVTCEMNFKKVIKHLGI